MAKTGTVTRKKHAKALEDPTAWRTSKTLHKVLLELAKHGNVTQALKTARAARGWVYRKRREFPDFEAEFEDARRCGIEVLKDEAHRRAYDGVEEPVFYQGEEVARIRKYSDVLLMFLIKQADPSYRERYDLAIGNAANGRPFMFQMMLHPDVAGGQGRPGS